MDNHSTAAEGASRHFVAATRYGDGEFLAGPVAPDGATTSSGRGALEHALALIEEFGIDAGQITIVVQHPRVVAYLDVNRRLKANELPAAS